jgi:hypothetical protein
MSFQLLTIRVSVTVGAEIRSHTPGIISVFLTHRSNPVRGKYLECAPMRAKGSFLLPGSRPA